MVHEREQTYHSTGMCPEPWSTASNAVSFLPSRPAANLICGVEQLPKLGPEAAVELVAVVRVVPLPLLDGVELAALFPLMGCPLSSRAVTSLKLVLKPKNLLNTAGEY